MAGKQSGPGRESATGEFPDAGVADLRVTGDWILERLGDPPYENSTIQLIDARSLGEYDAGRIPGAIHLRWTINLDGGLLLPMADLEALYADLDATWDARARHLNTLLAGADLPVRVANMSTVWTVLYTKPSRYNWMLQFYLRAEGLALSWVGTGRMIFSLAYDDAAFEAVATRFVAAAQAMRADGWWEGEVPSDRAIRRSILREVAAVRLGRLGDRLGLRAPDQA